MNNIFLCTFISLIIYYSLIKVVRTAILSTNRWLNLDDINIIFIVSIAIGLIVIQPVSILKIIFFIVVAIYSLLLWLDAIVFYLYSFEINKRNISEFINDYKSMLHYSVRSHELFKRYPWILFGLPLSIFAIILVFINGGLPITYTILSPVVLIVAIFILQKFSQSILRNIFVLSLLTILSVIFSPIVSIVWENLPNHITVGITLSIIGIITFLNIFKSKYVNTFFTLSSHFRKFLRDERLLIDSSILLEKEHEKLIVVPYKMSHLPTKYFGLLKGANVILITMESVGKKYLNDKMRLSFMNKLANGGISSNNHYAISPHTNQFLNHLFCSDYVQSSNNVLHKYLKKANYSTTFVSSADLNICETKDLIKEIGFEKIIDRNDLYKSNRNRGDYLLLDAVNPIKEILKRSQCFIQLLTMQSHYPYDTFDKDLFSNNVGFDLKSKYLNTIEETDHILNLMFDELSKTISLDDTLIVYVGDHGESFGELGYKAHSNSTINAQIRVPFYLRHKSLRPQTINFSTHFDIMPTILDLLGIKYDSKHIGSSIFSEIREPPSLYYSMVKKSNAPANVKICLDDKNIMIDRVLDYNLIIDENDDIIRFLTKDEVKYYHTLAYRMLLDRGLIF